MKKSDLFQFVGDFVVVTLKSGKTIRGYLGYTREFSSHFGFRKPDYFTVGDYDFKVSHIKKFEVLK